MAIRPLEKPGMRNTKWMVISFREAGIDPSAVEGPFLRADGSMGLLVRLGKSPSTAYLSDCEHVSWSRGLPPLRGRPLRVFVRRGRDRALDLGVASVQGGSSHRVVLTLEEAVPEALFRELIEPPARGPVPEEAIRALTPSSTPRDRMTALELFLSRWYALPPLPPLGEHAIPTPLAALHRQLGDNPRVFLHNRLFSDSDLAVEEDRLIFYAENQGVYVAATEPSGEDPPVFIRASDGVGWKTAAEPLSGFLIQAVLFEALMNPPDGASASWVEPALVRSLTRKMTKLPLRPWIFNEVFLVANGALALVAPCGDGFMVMVGACDPSALDPLESLLDEMERM